MEEETERQRRSRGRREEWTEEGGKSCVMERVREREEKKEEWRRRERGKEERWRELVRIHTSPFRGWTSTLMTSRTCM